MRQIVLDIKTIKPKFCRQIFVVKDKYWSCTCESWRYSTPFLFAKGGSTKSIYEFDFNIFTLQNHILPGLPYWYDSSFVNAAEKTTFGKYWMMTTRAAMGCAVLNVTHSSAECLWQSLHQLCFLVKIKEEEGVVSLCTLPQVNNSSNEIRGFSV